MKSLLIIALLMTLLGSDPAGACEPPVQRIFTLAESVPLECNASGARTTSLKIFDVELQERGFALARAKLRLRPTGATDITHFWNAHVVVGREQYALMNGDDICRDSPPATRVNFGYGELSDPQHQVAVYAYQGASPCVDGAIEVVAGSTLELWIEDDEPACRRKSIERISYYESVDFTRTYAWQTNMSPIVLKRTYMAEAGELLIMSVVEASPELNPNTVCGEEQATIAAELRVDEVIVDENLSLLPASQGQGHLVLDNEARQQVAEGFHLLELRVRRDFTTTPVRTGGCCGDAVLFVVKN